MYQLFAPYEDGGYLYHGLNLAAYGGKVNKFDGLNGDSKIITIGEFPKEFVDAHGSMTVRTPSGNTVPLSEAYSRWGGTHVTVDDVPGLTDYLTTQPQLYN